MKANYNICASPEAAKAYIAYAERMIPEHGRIGVITITDQQFSQMRIFYGGKKIKNPAKTPPPLQLF